MNPIKIENSYYLIPIGMFDSCLIDNLTKQEICKKYTKSEVTNKKSIYYLDKFNYHLNLNFNIDIKQYAIKYFDLIWPKCQSFEEDAGYRLTGQGIKISMYRRGGVNKQNCLKFKHGCDKLGQDRIGIGNPMYGKPSWNKGLTKENNETIKYVSEVRIGQKRTETTKEKQRNARRKSLIKERHTTPHSEKTKELLRKSTASLWQRGVFNKTTSIHIKMREFLNTLSLKEAFEEEYQIVYFSADFAFINSKVVIECQGSYYHVDPRIYPDGPINAMQRRNFGRDKAKKKFLLSLGWIIIEAWEPEINDGTFKENIKCKLKELNLLNH